MKKTLILLSALLFTMVLGACGTDNAEQNEDDVEIVFQSHITPNLTGEVYDTAIERFEEQNPDIKVKRIEGPDTDSSKYVKTLLASGDMPDVVHNITTGEFVEEDALLPIPVDEDIKKINNYDSQAIDGEIYNLFPYVQPQSLIFYNKELFKQAGIEEEPKTWDEFLEVSKTLKENDITPILTSSEWITALTFSIFSSPTIFGENDQWYKDMNEGKVSYTDSEWVEFASDFKEMAEKGYLNKGALSIGYSQLGPMFLSGEGAMYPMGTWFAAEESEGNHDFEVGVFPAPTKDGSKHLIGLENYGGYSAAASSEHPEEALKLVKFLAFDPEFHEIMGKSDSLFSNLSDPIYYEMTPLQENISEIIDESDSITAHLDAPVGDNPPAGLLDKLMEVAQGLIGGADPEEEMESLDDFWNEHKE